jgi:septal ring factor EnvC (AmiA/AmiB activator)
MNVNALLRELRREIRRLDQAIARIEAELASNNRSDRDRRARISKPERGRASNVVKIPYTKPRRH